MIAANDRTDAMVGDKWYEGMWKHDASRPIVVPPLVWRIEKWVF